MNIPELLGQTQTARFANSLPESERLSLERAMDSTVRALAGHGDAARLTTALACLADPLLRSEDRLAAVHELGPWKKGPHQVGEITIDAEWDCHRKWKRVEALGLDFAGQSILDVGAGNGFYLMQMASSGARFALGVEPSVPYAYQFLATRLAARAEPIAMVVQRVESLPEAFPRFDIVFSMGVIYHARSPIDHLGLLRRHLKKNGRLVLETITFEGTEREVIVPRDRYANMRNVWFLPSTRLLPIWLDRSGLRVLQTSELIATTTSEQRATIFSPGPSLLGALDPADPRMTIEGYPAPARQIVVAERTDP
jgi:tRNA (mo5U34)-methyltransferase